MNLPCMYASNQVVDLTRENLAASYNNNNNNNLNSWNIAAVGLMVLFATQIAVLFERLYFFNFVIRTNYKYVYVAQ